MDYVCRKITPAKWSGLTSPADAFATGGDLNVNETALSIWQCNQDRSDLKEVILALASNFAFVNNVDLVIFSKADLIAAGFVLQETLGQTPVEDLRSRHIDIVQLDPAKLLRLAEMILAKVNNKEQIRFIKSEVIAIVQEAVNRGRLDRGKLKEGLRAKIT